MAEETHNYSVNDDFPSGKIDLDRLTLEIAQSAITIALADITAVASGGDIDVAIKFKDNLPAADKTVLDGDTSAPCGGLIGAHSGEPLPDDKISYIRTCPTEKYSDRLFIKGRLFVAGLNGDSDDDYALPETLGLQGAIGEVEKFASGDYMELFVTTPAGVPVAQYGETVYVPPSGKIGAISDGATVVPAGYKVRARYHSVATSGDQPVVYIAYRFWK